MDCVPFMSSRCYIDCRPSGDADLMVMPSVCVCVCGGVGVGGGWMAHGVSDEAGFTLGTDNPLGKMKDVFTPIQHQAFV